MKAISNKLKLFDFFSASRQEVGLIAFARLAFQNRTAVHRHPRELDSMPILQRGQKSKNFRFSDTITHLVGGSSVSYETCGRTRISHAKPYAAPICRTDGANGARRAAVLMAALAGSAAIGGHETFQLLHSPTH